MGQTAASIDADVFQFFTRNPRGGAAKPLDPGDVERFNRFAADRGIGPALAHAPYTLNAASADPRIRDFAFATMLDDLKRLENVDGAMYNFHPGSHVGRGIEAGVEAIVEHLVAVFSAFIKARGRIPPTRVLLETMAGKGSEVGSTFEELREIADRVERALPEIPPLGVCLDTCHVWDAGFDIAADLDGTLAKFDSILGLGRLKAVHLNDSMNARASRKDRHACIGKGKIGLDALVAVVSHPALRELPFYLETPCDLDGYRAEIALVKARCASLRGDGH